MNERKNNTVNDGTMVTDGILCQSWATQA